MGDLIVNFLEKNYDLSTDGNSLGNFVDKINYGKTLTLKKLVEDISILFNLETIFVEDIVFEWYHLKFKNKYNNLFILINEANEDVKNHSRRLLNHINLMNGIHNWGYSNVFLYLFIESIYEKEILNNKFFNFIEGYYKKELFNSSQIERIIQENFPDELPTIYENLSYKANEWYFNNVFSKVIEDFFSHLKLVCFLDGWVAVHDTLGKLEPKDLMSDKLFGKENNYICRKISELFFQWMEEEKIKVCEKYMT